MLRRHTPALRVLSLPEVTGPGRPGRTGLHRWESSARFPPTRAERTTLPKWQQQVVAEWRNRIEVTNGELTGTIELARDGAHTFHRLLARTAATIAARCLIKVALPTA